MTHTKPEDTPLLDKAMLESLRALDDAAGGTFLCDLLAEYLTRAEQRTARMVLLARGELARADLDVLEREAHTLAGTSGSVGAGRMRIIAAALERVARRRPNPNTDHPDSLVELAVALAECLTETRRALEAEVPGCVRATS